MAKEDMICPFSGKLCKECPIYRGRHYYLCFSKKYRGHINRSGETELTKVGSISFGTDPSKRVGVPALSNTSVIDPFTRPLEDIKK